jgi:hypothetical protein
MPTGPGAEVIRLIDNVQVFREVTTIHANGLVLDGILWEEPIPAFAKPYTEVSHGYPWNHIVRNDFIQGIVKGKALNEEDTAPLGRRDIFGVEMLEPLHIAGESMVVTAATLREAMVQDRVAKMVTQPSEEWMRAAQEMCMDVVTAGAFSSSTNAVTGDFVPSVLGFDGVSYQLRKATNSADTSTATIANSNQSVQWSTRAGNLFAAGHSHVESSAGGAWTRVKGRARQLLITEHPGQQFADAFVGTAARDSINDAKEAWRGSDANGVGQTVNLMPYIEEGMRRYGYSNFAIPEYISDVDGVNYWFVKDLPMNFQATFARNTMPFRSFVGIRGEPGAPDEPPYAWTEELPRELRGPSGQAGLRYGFRGFFADHCQSPIGVAVTLYQ